MPSDNSTIMRQRQCAIRRELDRRGIPLKVISFDSLHQQLAEADYSPNVVAIYLVFNDPADAANLLQNETLQLDLRGMDPTEKPFSRLVRIYDALTGK